MNMFETQYNEMINELSQIEIVETPEVAADNIEITQDEFNYYEMVSRFENDIEVAEWYELTGEVIR